jgi:hypothetical protein
MLASQWPRDSKEPPEKALLASEKTVIHLPHHTSTEESRHTLTPERAIA